MTISILIPWFHPAYKAGGPIQSIVNMLEQFSENITYKIVCSNTDLGGEVLKMPTDIWTNYNNHTKVLYASKKKSPISVLKKELQKDNSHILFVNGIYSWRFNLAPLLYCKASRKIVSARGMLHPGALSQKRIKKNFYLFFWKALSLYKNCEFHASSEEEKKYIENIFGKKVKIFIAQNFPRKFSYQPSPHKKMGILKLISVALISPMKNHLFVLQALQGCNEFIEYNIYGPIKDMRYWQECLHQIKLLPSNISVKFHGDILPNKVEGALFKSHVFILPSKSENFGHAFYESLSAGKPLITSYNTPWKNLKASNAGINVSLENTNEIIDAIKCFAAMNEEQFKIWSLSANQYATKAIDTEKIKQQYHEMFFA